MHLKAAAVSLPICDWRVLSSNNTRQIRFATFAGLKPGATIYRFGRLGSTLGAPLPWRESEAYFFDCSRLFFCRFGRLPGGAPITRLLRRVYLDEALVRFEIAAFDDLVAHKRTPVALTVKRIVREFMCEPNVRMRYPSDSKPEFLASLLSRLPSAYDLSTRSKQALVTTECCCQKLNPEVQLVFETEIESVPPRATVVVPDTYWLSLGDVRLVDGDHRVATTCIYYRKGLFSCRDDAELKQLRAIRRQLRWMHADIEMLHALLGVRIPPTTSRQKIDWYLRKIGGILEEPLTEGMAKKVYDAYALEHRPRLTMLQEALQRAKLISRSTIAR
jgi:hypothetical protein